MINWYYKAFYHHVNACSCAYNNQILIALSLLIDNITYINIIKNIILKINWWLFSIVDEEPHSYCQIWADRLIGVGLISSSSPKSDESLRGSYWTNLTD